MSPDSSKQQARIKIKKYLKSLSSEVVQEKHDVIFNKVKTLFAELCLERGVNSALLYPALSRWHEADISEIKQYYKTVRFDCVRSSKDATPPTERFDLIFVPLLGFTDEGYRLGHGAGWYDRLLLGQSQAIKIGVGLEAGVCKFIPDAHDIAMDIIVTEDRLQIIQ